MTHTISDEQILRAALAVIVQRGYVGATTRHIAAAAGINEVTLFRRFGCKQALLRAVVEREAAQFGAAGIAYTGDVAADLVRIVRFYHQLVQTRGAIIITLLSEIPRQPELLDVIQTPLTILHTISLLLERYQQAGVLVCEPPMQAFTALIGPVFLLGALDTMQPTLCAGAFDPVQHVERYLAGRRA